MNSLNGLVMDCKDLPRFAEDVKQLQGLSQLPVGLEDDAGDGLGLCTCACVCLSAPRAGAGHACQEGAGCCDAS